MKALLSKIAGRKKKGILGALMALAAMAVAAVPAGAAPVDFSTQTGLSVAPADVIGTGFSFMGMFDSYTMIVLGIIFAPVAIGFVIWIWNKLPKLGKKSG